MINWEAEDVMSMLIGVFTFHLGTEIEITKIHDEDSSFSIKIDNKIFKIQIEKEKDMKDMN